MRDDRPSQCHLLHVCSTFGFGGYPLRMARLFNQFGRRYRHTIVALNGDRSCRSILDGTLEVSFPDDTAPKSGLIGMVAAARHHLKHWRPDLLLTYNWGAIEWALANTLFGTSRHLHFEEGFGPEEADHTLWRRDMFRRLALRGAHRVVVPSHRLNVIAAERWGIGAARRVLVPNGVDGDRFTPACTPLPELACRQTDTLVIGTVAPLRKEKAIDRLIRAAALLAARHRFRLVIAGDGPEKAALETLAAAVGLADRTLFLGHVHTVEAVLTALDIFVLPSDTEQMPIGLLEAMAAARPIAATDVGDVRAMLPEIAQTAIVPRDDVALATALEHLIVNGDLRTHQGAANRAHALHHYSLETMVARYRDLFDG